MSEIATCEALSHAASNEDESLDYYVPQADRSSDIEPSQVWLDNVMLAEGASWAHDLSYQDPFDRSAIDLDMQIRLNRLRTQHLSEEVQLGAYSPFFGPFGRTAISQNNADSEPIRDNSFAAESIVLTARPEHQSGRQVLWIGEATCHHWNQIRAAYYNAQKLRISISLTTDLIGCPLCRIIQYILPRWHSICLPIQLSSANDEKPTTKLGSLLDSGQQSEPAESSALKPTSNLLTLELLPGFPQMFDLKNNGNFLAKIALERHIGFRRRIHCLPGLYGFDAQIDTKTISQLVHHCCASHVICNNNVSGSESIELILLDVETMRLLNAQSTERYFALSYVWGGIEAPETRKSNIEELRHQGLRHMFGELPAVIEDAITLTKACSERYLWVDKLSIIQDDAENKYNQILQMDTIFSNAALTIVAFSGKDVSYPLPGLRKNSRPPIRLVGYGGSGIGLTLDPKSPSAIIESAFYETRGWTYQERVLSRRCLYLADNQALFQCREGCIPEAMWTSKDLSNMERLMATENTPDKFDFLNPLSKMWQSIAYGVTPSDEFWRTYTQLVRQYSSRSLSYNVDILHAFAGIITVLNRHTPSDFAQGLPLRFVDVALFWYQRGRLERRYTGSAALSSPTMDFPSWSWVGWVGPVSYLHSSAGQASYTQSDIGSFTFLHGDNLQLSSEAQNDPKGPQYRSWTPQTTTSGILHNIYKHLLKFSAKSFGSSLFKFNFNAFLAKDEFPVSKILDTNSQQCGVLFDRGELGDQLRGESFSSSKSHQFIVLSYSKRSLSRRSGFTHYSDDGYLEPFGEEYSMQLRPWRCVNVMLIRRIGEFYERVAVGMLHEKVLNDFAVSVETIQLI
jgi:hypothetical protein